MINNRNNNNKWSQLSLKEKAEIISLYVKNGFTNRKDIVQDFNTNHKHFQESNANFVQRLRNNDTRYIQDESGRPMTHRLGCVEDDNGATIFPEVQDVNGTLQIGDYNSAANQRDTVNISTPFAQWYTSNYKQDYPEFFNKFEDGSFKVNPDYVHPTIQEDNSLETKIWSKNPQLLQRLKKAGTLTTDLMRVLPQTALLMDIYDLVTQKRPEERTLSEDINTYSTALGTAGRSLQALYESPFRKIGETGFVDALGKAGKGLATPDLISDGVQFVKDFSTPINEFAYGSSLNYPFSKQPIPAVRYDTGGQKPPFQFTPFQQQQSIGAVLSAMDEEQRRVQEQGNPGMSDIFSNGSNVYNTYKDSYTNLANQTGQIDFGGDYVYFSGDSKMRTAKVPVEILEYIVKQSEDNRIPMETMLGLAAQEMVLGSNQFKKGQTSINPLRLFNYDRGIGQSAYVKASNMKAYHNAREKYESGTPLTQQEILAYNNAVKAMTDETAQLHPYSGDNLFKEIYDFYSSGNYNRGDKNHTKMVEEAGKAVMNDPGFKKWLNSRNKK